VEDAYKQFEEFGLGFLPADNVDRQVRSLSYPLSSALTTWFCAPQKILASEVGTLYTQPIELASVRAFCHYLRASALPPKFKFTSPDGVVRLVGGRAAGWPSMKRFIYACGAIHRSVDLQSPCDKTSFKMMVKPFAKTHVVTCDAESFDVEKARSQ
jgi:hypothetical protein